MAHRDPPGIIAPHIPADAYRRAEATGQPVVIVVHTTDHPAGRCATTCSPSPSPEPRAGGLGTGGRPVRAARRRRPHGHRHRPNRRPIGIGGITLRLARPKH